MKKKATNLDSDRVKFLTSAISWAYEMELVDDPQLLNNLYVNIYSQSKSIQDVELLINKSRKQILIYIKLSFFARLFKKTKHAIITSVLDNLNELLPEFKVRVTIERPVFNKALEQVT